MHVRVRTIREDARKHGAYVFAHADGDVVVVADDDVPRFVDKTGKWKLSEDPLAKRHDITFLLASQEDSASITYHPVLTKTGKYKVYAWWPKTKNAATNTNIQIFSSDGVVSFKMDQQNKGDGWESVGTYSFKEGQKDLIEINNLNANGMVIADAFKFEFVDYHIAK